MDILSFQRALDDFAANNITGSHRIARQASETFHTCAKHAFDKYHHLSDFARILKKTKDELIEATQHDVLTLNCLNKLFNDKEILKFPSMNKLYAYIQEQYKLVQSHLDEATSLLPQIGAEKIKKGSNIFIFGQDVEIENILLHALVQSKKFTVVNTEHRPSMQGREFAKDLAKKGIKVHHHTDLALRQAIRQADIVFIGCDAIDYHHNIFSEIGSELVAETANAKHAPVYVCTDSWKYDSRGVSEREESIKEKSSKQIWEKPPARVKVHNFAYEKINPKLITGIICEFGIVKPKEFSLKVKEKYGF